MTAYLAAAERTDLSLFLIVMLGISLSAGGALSFNQWWERDLDKLMPRTQRRPLPAKLLPASTALLWSLCLSFSGVLILGLGINGSSAFFAALTILLYGLVYTPLKQRTRWATEIGSISGALPPLIGAAAAHNLSSLAAWVLFAILLFWQMPHFFAIGWLYRKEYQAAGYPLLPAIDVTGRSTALWSLFHTSALLVVSLLPWALGWLSAVYGIFALGAGLCFFYTAWLFHSDPSRRDHYARLLFLGSILHLPVIMLALVIDRLLALT